MRLPKSLTLERSIVSGERVNELLRKATVQQQYERLEQEAVEFFSTPRETDRAEAKTFQKASMRSMGRD